MKTLIYYLLITFAICSISCSNESIEEIISDEITDPDPDTTDPDNDDPDGNATDTPCDFDLSDVTANSTITIDCVLDLEGRTVDLPTNVNFDYDGGRIINGTLNFSGGYIDGDLLNSKLTVSGDARLKDPTFNFVASRWDIVQGETTSSVAQENNDFLENLFLIIKNLEGTTFKIDELDAYFEVGKVTSTTTNQNFYPSEEGINVPSDFNLVMTDNTHLRVFPNDNPRYALLAIRDAANVTITGGNLHGDRDNHIFTNGGTHEKGHLMHLHAAVNVTITGLKMFHANGDGMKIDSLNFTFQSNYKPSNNIVVTGCTFDGNRRNNLSITDGFDILIENNTFLNAGIDTGSSTGTPPKFAIDIEAHRERADNGEIVYYERARDITLRNNTERASVAGGFAVYIGEDVIVEDNDIETSISWSYTTGTKIRNNTLTANPNRVGRSGIVGGRSDNTATTFGNEIYGNTIRGYESGITVFSRENKVYNNTIENCEQGIFLRSLIDSQIYGNKITSNVASSKGIFAHVTSLDNVEIYDNETNVTADPYKFVRVNTAAEANNFQFTVRNNNFDSSGRANIEETVGLNFNENIVNVSTSIYDSVNISLSGNTIDSGSSNGIHLRDVNQDITITNNSIQVTGNAECIKIESTTNSSEVSESNNSCEAR
ncbi:right-handed parallel beta-helix repeat-containing protein [Aquimarina sp. 2201CG5-10]|uniref:right-handed parallel beta-helix repeat-containing protein n=1 Tax=Aquimarina callyspongiae TaxID=3098150 RepID=UPI002AB38651|nr:right-handed parallel beta-helix repeat-containing protein [Aquimarina sp. 2201CG5-10]MDY8136289.1 right-handed parallel beta-helix repeat-containing protein [Aquimarina sp. 2201CG5-10]